MTRALVLGGGGPVGIAWELGVLAGLAEGGVDVTRADRIVGTSAGSVVGALLGAGRTPADLYADHHERAKRPWDTRPAGPPPDLGPLMQFMLRRPADRPPDDALMAEMGVFARRAPTEPEADYLAMICRLVDLGPSWPDRLVCTAVDAETGAFRVFDKASNVDLTQAIGASCAVPGLYPPVTVEGRRYIDGGVRSNTNIDLAEGCNDVLALAVTIRPFADLMAAAPRRELARLEASGSRTCLIVPDERSLDAFGPDLMATGRRAEVAEAGLEQGRHEARRLDGRWA